MPYFRRTTVHIVDRLKSSWNKFFNKYMLIVSNGFILYLRISMSLAGPLHGQPFARACRSLTNHRAA